jgi:hypothetical protein
MHYALSNPTGERIPVINVWNCEAEAVVPHKYSADLTSNTKLAGQKAYRESNPTRIMTWCVRHHAHHAERHAGCMTCHARTRATHTRVHRNGCNPRARRRGGTRSPKGERATPGRDPRAGQIPDNAGRSRACGWQVRDRVHTPVDRASVRERIRPLTPRCALHVVVMPDHVNLRPEPPQRRLMHLSVIS